MCILIINHLEAVVGEHPHRSGGGVGMDREEEALLLLLFLPCQAVNDVSNWLATITQRHNETENLGEKSNQRHTKFCFFFYFFSMHTSTFPFTNCIYASGTAGMPMAVTVYIKTQEAARRMEKQIPAFGSKSLNCGCH